MKHTVCQLPVLVVALVALTARAHAVDGACGPANATWVAAVPTTDLCVSGNPTSVGGGGPWNWSCAGSNGGATATCWAGTANRLSINLAGLSYYSRSLPFKDLMFQVTKDGKYRTDGAGATVCQSQPEDQDGYPLSLDTANNCFYQYLLVPGVPYPTGHYVLTYDGTGAGLLSGDAINVQYLAPGRVEFDVAVSTLGIWLTITATSQSDHLRNFHVLLASDEATYQVQPFRQAFLDLLSPFRIIRFMDWSGVSKHSFVGTFSGISQPDAYTIVLPADANAPSVDDAYANDVAVVHSGTQWPRVWIDHYDGATRTIHLSSPLPVGATTEVYVEDFPNRTWDRRTPSGNQRQQGAAGVAYEHMVQLANVTNKDMWITIPTAADDDFVLQLATLLMNTLNRNLKIYIEYSNETWNPSYQGYDYSEAIQKKLGLVGSSTTVPADAWHPYRALQIFHLFNRVFGEPDLRLARDGSGRLVRVITSQTSWPDRFAAVVNWINANNAGPTYGRHAYEYADAVAVTDYWGFPSQTDFSALLQLPTDQLLTQMIALQKQAIDEAVSPASTSGKNYLYVISQIAHAFGINVVAYEGGESFVPGNADPALLQAIINDLQTMNHDLRMADVYLESLTKWQWLSQQFPGTIGNWAQFYDVGPCSQYGCWGLLDSILQDPGTAPRYQGIINFLNANKHVPSTF